MEVERELGEPAQGRAVRVAEGALERVAVRQLGELLERSTDRGVIVLEGGELEAFRPTRRALGVELGADREEHVLLLLEVLLQLGPQLLEHVALDRELGMVGAVCAHDLRQKAR